MKISSDGWQLLCTSIAHKQELLTYAAECGVRVAPELWGHHTDPDLYLNWWGSKVGIAALPKALSKERSFTAISPALFKTMCQAYAEGEPQRALLMST